mmetsp:Transcript_8590/g.29326  ORF Transcript_8590/g.29326 Transcript_8590/m.29326 type:complete len:242 (+) Transcript_8590:974-1699(+)
MDPRGRARWGRRLGRRLQCRRGAHLRVGDGRGFQLEGRPRLEVPDDTLDEGRARRRVRPVEPPGAEGEDGEEEDLDHVIRKRHARGERAVLAVEGGEGDGERDARVLEARLDRDRHYLGARAAEADRDAAGDHEAQRARGDHCPVESGFHGPDRVRARGVEHDAQHDEQAARDVAHGVEQRAPARQLVPEEEASADAGNHHSDGYGEGAPIDGHLSRALLVKEQRHVQEEVEREHEGGHHG